MFQEIEKGELKKWKVKVKIMKEIEEEKKKYKKLDIKKVWKNEEYKKIDIGVMEMKRKKEKYLKEVENEELQKQNIVKGIGFQKEKMIKESIL